MPYPPRSRVKTPMYRLSATVQQQSTGGHSARMQWLAGLGIEERIIYVDESGYNICTRRTKERAPVGQRVRLEGCARGRNMIILLAINQELGVVHHQLGRFTVTREVFQEFVTADRPSSQHVSCWRNHSHCLRWGTATSQQCDSQTAPVPFFLAHSAAVQSFF